MSWARLLKRFFDIEHCPQGGGDLKILAAIEAPAVIVRILTHLGLPAGAPPRSPALFRAACEAAARFRVVSGHRPLPCRSRPRSLG
jgi:hypothetical protein